MDSISECIRDVPQDPVDFESGPQFSDAVGAFPFGDQEVAAPGVVRSVVAHDTGNESNFVGM